MKMIIKILAEEAQVRRLLFSFINKMASFSNEKKLMQELSVPLLRQLKKEFPKIKLVVAVGKEKEKILTAALRGGLVDSLYIDEPTAELIVRHNPIN